MEAETLFTNPFGSFAISRERVDRSGTLRAWDGADHLLLDHVATLSLAPNARVLVVGDDFGALSVSLSAWSPTAWSDSVVSELAVSANHRRNELANPEFILSTDEAATSSIEPFDLIVWNVPRSTELVAHVASLLSRLSSPKTVVLAAGMDKHLPPKTGEILRTVGDVTTHPGKRKAHIFEVRVPVGRETLSAIPGPVPEHVRIPEHNLQLVAGPGVFSADRFDLGTRLLAHEITPRLHHQPNIHDIVDLGCGTGALGILALRAIPEANVFFVDESRLAVQSAEKNVAVNAASLRKNAHFVHADIFGDDWNTPLDLVLCNPPFHHANAMSDEVAWQMFVQAHRHLRPGGELWVVANRHLAYHAKLTRIFGNVSTLASHPKFVVLAATR